ncbi:DUF1617 family protein [Sutcliffiella sp. FSL R7-0096]|uniref:DUF1617 family protein n=1 Tax=Sutcliffiella sp. FSL R7-0096 TaxID=2921670 RepID=UPI003159F313
MKIQISYNYVAGIASFLINLKLKGKQSRHRTRLANLLIEKNKQIAEEELELIKEYAGVNENGAPNKKENGNFDIEDVAGFKQQQEELLSEKFIIEGGDHHGMLKTVKAIVLDYDGEVAGSEAFAYDHICEAFENADEESDEE